MKTRETNERLTMRIIYKDKKAEKQFSAKYKKSWRYPELVKVKLTAAAHLIENAKSLQDVATHIPFHFEKLKGDRKDEWSIRLGGNTGYRAIMVPCDDDEVPLVGGDILASCKIIKIIMVTEVTNHYE